MSKHKNTLKTIIASNIHILFGDYIFNHPQLIRLSYPKKEEEYSAILNIELLIKFEQYAFVIISYFKLN